MLKDLKVGTHDAFEDTGWTIEHFVKPRSVFSKYAVATKLPEHFQSGLWPLFRGFDPFLDSSQISVILLSEFFYHGAQQHIFRYTTP